MGTIYFQCPSGSGLIDIIRGPVPFTRGLGDVGMTKKAAFDLFCFSSSFFSSFLSSFLKFCTKAKLVKVKNPQSNCRVGTFWLANPFLKSGHLTSNETPLACLLGSDEAFFFFFLRVVYA